MPPLAYHITFTAYGTWLHGDSRGWIETGTPCILDGDALRAFQAQVKMSEPSVAFDDSQRRIITKTIHDHCRIRKWELLALNVRSNHVHLVVTADRNPEEVMNQLKAWCSRKLSDALGLPKSAGNAGRKKWFTEHGSTKWINDGEYLSRAIRYVAEGQ